MDPLLQHLMSLTPEAEAQPAPDFIEFTAHDANDNMRSCDGSDHMMWLIGIGKDHTATILMHKDDYAALKEIVAAETPYKKY